MIIQKRKAGNRKSASREPEVRLLLSADRFFGGVFPWKFKGNFSCYPELPLVDRLCRSVPVVKNCLFCQSWTVRKGGNLRTEEFSLEFSQKHSQNDNSKKCLTNQKKCDIIIIKIEAVLNGGNANVPKLTWGWHSYEAYSALTRGVMRGAVSNKMVAYDLLSVTSSC